MRSLLSLGGLGSGSGSLRGLGRWGDVVLGVLGGELEEVLESAVTIVLEEFGGSGGLEHESGEASDLEGSACGKVVFGGVHLGAKEAYLSVNRIYNPSRARKLTW